MTEGSSAEEKFRNRVLQARSDIPDANKIHEARKKREEMRKIAQDPTYIQISKKRKMSNKPGSRLAPRDSDDEEQNITRMKGQTFVSPNGNKYCNTIVDNTTSRLDDDIDRGREMDDDSVIDWEKNLIRGSAIPGPNPEQSGFYNANTDIRPIGVRIREKITDLNERLAETKNNQIRIESEFESHTER